MTTVPAGDAELIAEAGELLHSWNLREYSPDALPVIVALADRLAAANERTDLAEKALTEKRRDRIGDSEKAGAYLCRAEAAEARLAEVTAERDEQRERKKYAQEQCLAAEARIASLTAWLKDALEGWREAAQYKGDFLLEKHGDMQEIDAIWSALNPKGTKPMTADIPEKAVEAAARAICDASVWAMSDQSHWPPTHWQPLPPSPSSSISEEAVAVLREEPAEDGEQQRGDA